MFPLFFKKGGGRLRRERPLAIFRLLRNLIPGSFEDEPGQHRAQCRADGYAHCQLQGYVHREEAGKDRPEGTAAEIGVLEEANDHAYKEDGVGQRAGYSPA